MIGGVAAGTAEYFNVDVSLVRIAFVALTLTTGAGLLLYLAMWLILPEASPTAPVGPPPAPPAAPPAPAPEPAAATGDPAAATADPAPATADPAVATADPAEASPPAPAS